MMDYRVLMNVYLCHWKELMQQEAARWEVEHWESEPRLA